MWMNLSLPSLPPSLSLSLSLSLSVGVCVCVCVCACARACVHAHVCGLEIAGQPQHWMDMAIRTCHCNKEGGGGVHKCHTALQTAICLRLQILKVEGDYLQNNQNHEEVGCQWTQKGTYLPSHWISSKFYRSSPRSRQVDTWQNKALSGHFRQCTKRDAFVSHLSRTFSIWLLVHTAIFTGC
jgi:hypothetical protein